jgi:uncharacterized protein (TIGR02145 family)
MKSNIGWKDNGNGTNENGFSGLPGGNRNSNGDFSRKGEVGSWWCLSFFDRQEFEARKGMGKSTPFLFNLFYAADDNFMIVSEGFNEHFGLSVRCIKKKKRMNMDE